jgi:hypothetical protein
MLIVHQLNNDGTPRLLKNKTKEAEEGGALVQFTVHKNGASGPLFLAWPPERIPRVFVPICWN